MAVKSEHSLLFCLEVAEIRLFGQVGGGGFTDWGLWLWLIMNLRLSKTTRRVLDWSWLTFTKYIFEFYYACF